jgi:hypothetical protein
MEKKQKTQIIEEPVQDEAPKRKAGGQPGNTNRLTHGYYSKNYKRTEREALLALREGLTDEVEMLRVAIHRVFKCMYIPRGSEMSAWQKNTLLCQTLSTLGIATTRLCHAMRTQKFLEGGAGSEMDELLNNALDILENDDRADDPD